MEYSPYFLSQEMQEHEIIQATNSALPYALVMDEARYGPRSPSYNLPQALALAASPYINTAVLCMDNEKGLDYAAMHTEEDEIPKVESYIEPHNHAIYAETDFIMQCMAPPLPLWGNDNMVSAVSLASAPDCPLNEQNISHLLSLQSLLKCQYGIYLTLDQLLAFDALPALLQPENDHQEQPQLQVKLEPAAAPLHTSPHRHMQAADAKQACFHADVEGSTACESSIHSKTLSCVNEAFRLEDISSPGSATSSSVVTDSDTGEKAPLHGAEYCNIILSPTRNLGPPANNQSWIVPSISWVPRGTAGHGRDQSNILQALSSTAQDLEACERPAQRRKLQGITLEQVLQAEKLQQVNVATQVKPTSKLIATCEPTLLHATYAGGDVLSASAENGTRTGSYAALGDLQSAPQEVTHEISLPLLQSRKPAATSVEPQSIAARHRRQRIKEKTESLGLIIPGATRLDTAGMFDLAIKYVHFMQAQMVCLENEVNFCSSSWKRGRSFEEYESVAGASFRRALIHRLLSSQEVQHFLSKEGLCLVTESLASRLNFDPSALLSNRGPAASTAPHELGLASRAI
ncbi:hypothetical protein L7F22_029962 [Adiantum nelumboides]|nr:hypothetical protein [Adiantum nelumboides]